MIISVGEFLQVVVSHSQQSDLLLQAAQQDLRPRHGGLFMGADHLLNVVVFALYGKQELGEDAFVLLKDRLSRVLAR